MRLGDSVLIKRAGISSRRWGGGRWGGRCEGQVWGERGGGEKTPGSLMGEMERWL